jgi:predicted acylesterase/phospholipase RssA
MAVSMPLFFEPIEMAGELWCDGGIVDILPVVRRQPERGT